MLFPVCLATLVLLDMSLALPHGAPAIACHEMYPLHGTVAQKSPAPYKLILSATTYQPNGVINGTIQGVGSATFRGFLVEPRPSNGEYKTLGSLTPLSPEMHNLCKDEVALTHANNTDKTSVSFSWKAPGQDAGSIVFEYSIVQVHPTFWVRMRSDEVKFRSVEDRKLRVF